MIDGERGKEGERREEEEEEGIGYERTRMRKERGVGMASHVVGGGEGRWRGGG